MTVSTTLGLAPVRERLPNGLTVLVKTARTTPAVTMNAALQAGGIFEPEDQLGLATLLGRVMDRGTAHRSADEIAEQLDVRGVSLNIGVTRHLLTLSSTCLSADFDAVLQIAADVIRQPTCPDDEIATRRGELQTLLRQDEDHPAVRAAEKVMELLYGARHPYGRPPKGTLDTVARIGRDDLLAFHRHRIAPASVSLVVVGDVGAADAVAAASRVFADWSAAPISPAALQPPPAPTARRRAVLSMMDKSQADIAYGFTTIVRSDPAYHAFWIMNNVFGQYGMGGRLGHRIREQQGMAYYAFSSFEANVIPGPLVVRAGVSGANVDRAIASIDEEVGRMAAEGVTEEELDESKRYLIGSLPRTLETNAAVATFLQTVEQFDLGLDYDVRLPDLIRAVTRDQVSEAARRTLDPQRACLAIAGPYVDESGLL